MGSQASGEPETTQSKVLVRLATATFLGLAAATFVEGKPLTLPFVVGIAWAWSWLLAFFAFGAASVGRRFGDLAKILALSLLVGCVTTFLVRPQELRTSGPIWVALALLTPAAGLLFWWTRRSSSRLRAIVPALILVALNLCDRLVFPGLYPTLHLGLSFLGACTATLTVAQLLPKRIPKRYTAPLHSIGALLLVYALVPSSFAEASRWTISRSEGFSKNLLIVSWALTDIDGDSSSAVFGAGDCDDLDFDIGINSPDIPEDGIDQDCSGFDRPDVRAPSSKGLPSGFEPVRGVLLVTADSLRADVVGAYGFDEHPSTPHIDRLAREAKLFSRVYAAGPETRLSFDAALGGRYPHIPSPAIAGLGEVLRKSGRNAVTVYPYGSHLDELVVRLGFESHRITGTDRRRPNSDETADAALEQVARLREYFFLLLVDHLDLHDPYGEVPDFPFGDSQLERYLAEVARCDRATGRLIEAAGPEIAVIFASDHGEAFGEHGMYYHRSSLYDEQFRVPLLIRVPGIEPGRVDETVGLIDLYTTIAELLGVSVPPGSHSRSLVPALMGESLPLWPYRGSTLSFEGEVGPASRKLGVFLGPYKYIVSLGWNLVEVYDITRDPDELHPNEHIDARTLRELQQLY